MVWLKLSICLVIILIAGSRLSRYADALGEKTKLGRVWIGIVLLAAITSMPELATGVSSVTLLEKPNLTLGDLFGSNLINILLIALLDILYTKGPLLYFVGSGIILVASASVLLMAVVGVFMYIVQNISPMAISGYIGIYSPVLLCLYLLLQYMIFRFQPVEQPKTMDQTEKAKYGNLSLVKTIIYFILATLATIGAGIWLSFIGDELARVTALGTTFVGTVFIAISTSAPEIAVSLSALRLGALDMAVGNLLGSNMFNMGFIIFVDDITYGKGPLFTNTIPEHMITVLFAILMNCIIIVALVFRLRYWSRVWISVDTLLIVGLYILAIGTLYALSVP